MIANEPVVTAAVIQALVVAVLAVLISFGVPMTEAQKVAIVGLVAVVAPFLAALWQRRRVTPLANPRDNSMTALVRVDGKPVVK